MPRSISVALLALASSAVPFVSCSDPSAIEASQPAAPILGTWTLILREPEVRPSTPTTSTSPANADETLKRGLRALDGADDISVRITWQNDRTGRIETSAPGVSRVQTFTWSLLAAEPGQIKIEQELDDSPRLERISYRIEAPDRMTILTGTMTGASLVRVQ